MSSMMIAARKAQKRRTLEANKRQELQKAKIQARIERAIKKAFKDLVN